MCIKHSQITNNDEVDIYYKNVIRSLVYEAIEMSNCLNNEFIKEKTAKSNNLLTGAKCMESTNEQCVHSVSIIFLAILFIEKNTYIPVTYITSENGSILHFR